MSSGKLTVKPSDKNKTFSFNLCDESRMSINIGKQWVISFPEPKHLLFINSLARKIKKEVKIGIENVKYPAEWIVNENELMSLIINNNEIVMSKNMKVSCSLTSTQTFFQIFLNSLAIIDCKEEQISEPKTYDFTFDVVLWNNKGEEVFRKHESINIRFSEIHTIPNIKLIITNEEVTFSGDLAVETIGYLALSNDSQLSYFPDIDCRVFFSAWNCKDKLPLNNFYLDIAKLPLTMLDNRNPNEFEIHQIQSRKTGKPASQLIKIPIKADFTKLGNPYDVETKSYELKVSVNYNHSNDKNKKAQLPTLNNEFKLHRNPAKAELRIILINEHGKGENKINLNDTVTLAKTHYLPGSTLQFWHKIHFRNQSEHGIPGSGIVIKNINHEIKFLPEDLCEIIYSKRQSSTLSVFNIRGVNLDELQSGIIIPSTKNDGKEIEFGFDSDSIKEAFHFTGKEKNYNIEVQMNLVFEYWEQDNEIIDIDSLPESERKTFKATFILPIYQEPYPEWLGVDFGTSAIVSQYGDKILDLHFEKNKLFNLAIQDNNIDSYEIGTPFLSSNIIFQNNAQINNNSPLSQLLKENNTKIPYNSLALCLSPTTEQEDANVRYILPCLKLMVGYDILPNINNYQNFRFYTNTNGEILRSALHN